jgi:hypothetical protein
MLELRRLDKRLVAGWIAVGVSTAVCCFWAVWGILENFHEGWYHDTWLANLGLMFVQYLSPVLIFLAVTLLSIFWPRPGAGLHGLLALLAVWFLGGFSSPVIFVLVVPLLGLGLLYWYGRPRPRKLAAGLAVGLPLLALVVSGTGPALRVSQRVDDGILEARLVRGIGVDLIWAPQGPGWPRAGTDWPGAQRACRFLDPGGLALAPQAQDVWRLPTVDEAVRSMARRGRNSGGVWDAESATAAYEVEPDKESPLWNVHSQVIYWWTSTQVDGERAYIIVYDGKVWPRSKDFGPDYLGYRCVRGP